TEASSPGSPRPIPKPVLRPDTRLGDTRLWGNVLFSCLYSLTYALGSEGKELSVLVVLKALAEPQVSGANVLSLVLSALRLLLPLLVSAPVELHNFVWFHHPVFCARDCRGYYFVRELYAYATLLSLASQSAERCLAVCQPLRAHRLLTPRRPGSLLLLVWAASFGLAVIIGQEHELETVSRELEPAPRVCTLQVFTQVNVLVPSVLPLALTAFLNRVTINQLVSLCSQMPS
uniref:G-protein coupled receptors family 1 profile domain-containing protein n=1 Tax=Loxodonta africana TaxID=9785 RepID=G3THM4_LOXAF